MLDDAGASTFLRSNRWRPVENSNKSNYRIKKFKEIKSEDGSKELPYQCSKRPIKEKTNRIHW